jgi:subtilisin family serine protease
VQLTPGSDAAAESRRAAANGGGSVSHVYGAAFHGFAGSFTDQAIERLRSNPRVAVIEADGPVTAFTEQTNPVWGLDRVDDRVGLDRSYVYPDSAGAGVTAYVIDTGVARDAEFGSRLVGGTDKVTAGGDGTNDCNGHGTHVAGTLGGNTYGVAKAVTIVPVRVLDCAGSGTLSGVAAGVDWVVAHHGAEKAVANMSLGGSASTIIDNAVKRAVADGVTVAVAAGNNRTDACRTSPARVPEAVTVGATDSGDQKASFSNYGTCLDLFAPGVDIESVWIGGTTDTISGTSTASPHVAGAAALVLSQFPTALSPVQVRDRLVATSTPNVVGRAGKGSANRLLFVG